MMLARIIFIVIALNLSSLAYPAIQDLEPGCDSCLGKKLDKSEFSIKPTDDLDACKNSYQVVSGDLKFNEVGYWYGEVTSAVGESLEIAAEIYGLGEHCSNFPDNKCPVRTTLSIEELRKVIENFPSEFLLFFPSLKAPVKGMFQEGRLGHPPGLMGTTLRLKLKPESGKFLIGEKGIIGSRPEEITIYNNTADIIPDPDNGSVNEFLITNIRNDGTLEIWANHSFNLYGGISIYEYLLNKKSFKKCESFDTWGD